MTSSPKAQSRRIVGRGFVASLRKCKFCPFTSKELSHWVVFYVFLNCLHHYVATFVFHHWFECLRSFGGTLGPTMKIASISILFYYLFMWFLYIYIHSYTFIYIHIHVNTFLCIHIHLNTASSPQVG